MLQILIIAVLGLLAQFVLPWWVLAVVAFGVCYWRSAAAGRAFGYGLAGSALVWLAYALVIHGRTDGILTGRMGQLLFQTPSASLPLLATSVLAGLVGGLAGVAGFYVRQAIRPQIVGQKT